MKQVVAAIIIRDSQILICQRTRHQVMPLKWEFPGGKIESGEQPRDALSRELDEELGIRAVIGHEVARLQHQYEDGGSVQLRFYLVIEFQGEVENRIFRDIRWVYRADLPGYDFLAADIVLCQQIADGLLVLE